MKRSDFLKWSAMAPLSLAGYLSPKHLFASTRCPPTSTVTVTGPTTTVVSTVTQTVTTGTTPNFPASFFTGPLGSRNVVPATETGALLGMHDIVQGWSETQQEALTQQRIADCGRNFDVIHQFGCPDHDGWKGINGWEDWAHNLGAVPMITLQGMAPTATLAAVNAGSCDAQFAAIANYLKTKPYRIMLRLFHEFNGNWFPWSVPAGSQNGNVASTPAQFVSAWRRVVGIFQTNSAGNCGFAWSPDEGQDRTIRDGCYPGDPYVDWVSPDHYNANDTGWSSPYGPGWSEFKQIFGYTGFSFTSTYAQYAAAKPFIPGEFGTKYDTADVNRKANWYRNILTAGLPNLRGAIAFDADVRLYEGQTWRVDERNDSSIDATTYQGFKDFSHDPAWNVGVSGGAT